MATRRPRVKPAAILKPRRAQSSSIAEQTATTSVKSESKAEDTTSTEKVIRSNEIAETSAFEQATHIVTESQLVDVKPTNPFQSLQIELAAGENRIDTENAVEHATENKPPDGIHINHEHKPNLLQSTVSGQVSTAPKPFRRMLTPAVNIVGRRKNNVFASENHPFDVVGSPPAHHIQSPAYSSYAHDGMKFKDKFNTESASPRAGTHGDEEVFSPAPSDNDECFKSPPFMSPSIYSRRPDPSMSPFNDVYHDDYAKSPASMSSGNSGKIRQRIRPTPCFGNRRNSVQGIGSGNANVCNVGCGASESEDDFNRRQRHFSTSSNHSNYTPATTPQQQRAYFGLNKLNSRIRTESLCSNASDAPSIRDLNTKTKRSHRSEEFQRVANAKREFNQRLNGKAPDKSRLTMYDLIYYNPLTNPMSKPAVKSETKDRSDSASISSIRTIQSRNSSIKSEPPPVKSENTDSMSDPMPVPQLKLGPNGEIVLDEKSLVIETTGGKEAREMLANSDIVYDDEFSGTSGFYKRHKRTKDWPPIETIKFYRSLQTIGTDFSVMLQLFPNRSRRDLKLKFKKEEKYNMALINKALLHPKEFNVDDLKLQFDKEDQEIETKKSEWAEIRKKIASDRKEQLSTTKKRNPSKMLSTSARALTDGDALYENEFVKLPKTRRQRMKRALSTNEAPEDVPKNAAPNNSIDCSLHSFSLNNNNLVDVLPTHTYATHKLPSFTEMLSSQKISKKNLHLSPQHKSESRHIGRDTIAITFDEPTNTIPPTNIISRNPLSNRISNTTIESNAMATNGVDASHSFNSSESLGKEAEIRASHLVTNGSQNQHNNNNLMELSKTQTNNGGTDQLYINDDTLMVNQYTIAKNQNLTFKGDSDDIMNMDIIFENVSIEEDPTISVDSRSIATTSTTISNPLATSRNQCNSLPITSTVPTTCAVHSGTFDVTASENININGVQYEIITVNSIEKDKQELNAVKNQAATVQNDVIDVQSIDNFEHATDADVNFQTLATAGTVDDSILVLNQSDSNRYGQYLYNSSEMVIISSSVETANVANENQVNCINTESAWRKEAQLPVDETFMCDGSLPTELQQLDVVATGRSSVKIERIVPQPIQIDAKSEIVTNTTNDDFPFKLEKSEQETNCEAMDVEDCAKPTATSVLKRKRKPPPVLVCRNKRTKIETGQISTEKSPSFVDSSETQSESYIPKDALPEHVQEDPIARMTTVDDTPHQTLFVVSEQYTRYKSEPEIEVPCLEETPNMTGNEDIENDDDSDNVNQNNSYDEEAYDNAACDGRMDSDNCEQEKEGKEVEEEEDDQPMDFDTEQQDESCLKSLVVVESQDPNDPTKTIHEVYVVNTETNEMSEQPLDLADDVIQRIRMSMQSES